jgi:FAD:protein FMN transferase
MTTTLNQLVEHRFRAMGTEVVVLVPAERDDAAGTARTIIDDWDRRFSRFDPTSELSRLNATAGATTATAVSRRLCEAVATALAGARATDGLFDPLLGARIVELGYDRTFERLGGTDSSAPLSPWVAGQWRAIELDHAAQAIRMPAGTALDLGGLAKGMAVDAAVAVLGRMGVTAAVNAGGDLAVYGLPPGESSWTVAIDGLADTPLALTEGGLATSSTRRRRWQTGAGERHHLLDPRNGLPAASGLSQVSVAAASCAQAEVAATAALLLGPTAAPIFLARHRLHGLLVTDDGTTVRV